jgi:hypothetical protein
VPKLRNMLGETAEVVLPVDGDEPLVVHYRRGAITPRLQARMADAMREAAPASGEAPIPSRDAIMLMVEMAAVTLVSWNLTDDDEVTIPIDAEHLADVDFGTLNLIMTEIGRQNAVDPLSSGGSSNGSSPTASSELRPITTAS